MENVIYQSPWPQMLTPALVGATVFHYAARLGFGPFVFWLLDLFQLLALVTCLPKFIILLRDRGKLKSLFQDRRSAILFVVYLVLGAISGCLIGYAQH